MRVTNINMYSSMLSESLSFALRDVDPTERYLVRGIVGMDAEEIIPKFYGFSSASRLKYYDFSMKPRDVALRVVLNPNFRLDESYTDIRDDLYRAISATRTGQVVLHFLSGASVVAKLEGFITKFEASYFTKLPEAQLTITCDDPMFRGISPVHMEAADFNIPPMNIPDSISTAPHGFSMQVRFTVASTTFTIQDVPSGQPYEWWFKVTPTNQFQPGDVLYFSSEFGEHDLYVIRNGTTTKTYLIDKLDINSQWPVIFPGQNSFYLPESSKYTIQSVDYYPAYWGV